MRREEVFAYADVDAAIHWLLGHPAPVQGEMQFECQLVTYGLYCGKAGGYRDPRAAQLPPGTGSSVTISLLATGIRACSFSNADRPIRRRMPAFPQIEQGCPQK
jgi:hypothetical protein